MTLRATSVLSTLCLLLAACSARNCDNDGLQSGRFGPGGGVHDGGDAGVGGDGGIGGDGGGGGTCLDCNGDGECTDFATDPEHCGVCEHFCGTGNICDQGHCVLGSVTSQAGGIDSEGTDVYVLRKSGIFVVSTDPMASQPAQNQFATVVPIDLDAPALDFALAPDVAYASFLPPGLGEPGGVYGRDRPSWLEFGGGDGAIDTGTNYVVKFIDAEGSDACWPHTGGIRCRAGGTTYEHPTPSTSPTGVDVVQPYVYWFNERAELWRAEIDAPSNTEPFATLDPVPQALGQLSLAGQVAYVVTTDGLSRADTNGGVANIAETMVTLPGDLIKVGAHVYFGDSGSPGRLYRVLADGTGPLELLHESTLRDDNDNKYIVGYLHRNGDYIFFTEFGNDGGRVLRRHLNTPFPL